MVDRTFQPPLDAQNSTENLSQIKINGLRHINSNSSKTKKMVAIMQVANSQRESP